MSIIIKCLVCVNSFGSHPNPVRCRFYYYFHFTAEEAEEQGGLTCQKWRSKWSSWHMNINHLFRVWTPNHFVALIKYLHEWTDGGWKHAWTNGWVKKETVKRLETSDRKTGVWGTLAFKTHMFSIYLRL